MQRVERALSQGIRAGTDAELDAAEQFTTRERTAKEELESQRRTTERLRSDSDEAVVTPWGSCTFGRPQNFGDGASALTR